MIKSLGQFLCLLSITLLFVQCSDSDSGKRNLPRHSGESGEILIVMNEKPWLGNPGDSLRKYLEAPYPMLPQREAQFSLLQFSTAEMSSLLRQHRNIIQVIIGADSEGQNRLTYTTDKWSNHQLVFTIRAENENAFYDVLRKDLPGAVKLINKAEVERYESKYKRVGNEELEAKIKKGFGAEISIPRDFELAEQKKNFLWLKRERVKYQGNTPHDITQGLFIYTYPYTSDSLFSNEAILAIRDSIIKENVPGPKEGTYMTTEYFMQPETYQVDVNGKYGMMTRGLWKVENYFMGGPFMSLTTTSEDDSKLICISGFVFAPKFNKREYIREIEAMLSSVRIPATRKTNS